MKKIILSFMLCAAFMLTACGEKQVFTEITRATVAETTTEAVEVTTEAVEVTTEEVEVTTEEVEVTTEAASQNILMGELQTEELMNGSGDEEIGERAYIEITKKQLKSLTEEEYAEFAENVVKDSGYNWVSIICDDGTGITFVGSMSIIAEYGEIDESDGKISEAIGNITYSESGYTYSKY